MATRLVYGNMFTRESMIRSETLESLDLRVQLEAPGVNTWLVCGCMFLRESMDKRETSKSLDLWV
jgi:hypothetical protein